MSILANKIAVVTGGGRGLGAAIAKGFAKEGAQVIILDTDMAAGRSVSDEILAMGGAAESEVLDISNRHAVIDCANRLTTKFGAIQILVNNAGIAPLSNLEDDKAVEVWDRVISVNLNAQFDVTRAFLPALKMSGGSIIFLSSIAGYVAPGSSAGYGAAKSGIISLTRSMARDLASHGIRVNALAPGLMITDQTKGVREGDRGARHLERVPLGRCGEPSEVAGPAIFLASTMSSYVTGATIPVDGGFLAV